MKTHCTHQKRGEKDLISQLVSNNLLNNYLRAPVLAYIWLHLRILKYTELTIKFIVAMYYWMYWQLSLNYILIPKKSYKPNDYLASSEDLQFLPWVHAQWVWGATLAPLILGGFRTIKYTELITKNKFTTTLLINKKELPFMMFRSESLSQKWKRLQINPTYTCALFFCRDHIN